jgi:hypothetical protein
MSENEPLRLKLPESELKNVTSETMGSITRPSDEDIRNLLDEQTVSDEQPKKRRGRPKKSGQVVDEEAEAKRKQEIEEQVKDLMCVVEYGMGFLAERLPNPIPPAQLEIEAVTKSLTRVMKKYGDKVLDYAPEIALLGSVAFFVVPRTMKPKNERA